MYLQIKPNKTVVKQAPLPQIPEARGFSFASPSRQLGNGVLVIAPRFGATDGILPLVLSEIRREPAWRRYAIDKV